MKSKQLEKNILAIEVSHISAHGFWLLVCEREYFLPFDEYPWFRDASIRQIQSVQLLHGRHLCWPDLDVDLELESLEQPALYPLRYQ